MVSNGARSHLGEKPTVVIDKLPPRELTIEQAAILPEALPKPRWSRSQKGVLWTLGIAIYGLALTNIFVWESKENKEQLPELEKTRNTEQVTTTSSMPDAPSTTVPSLDFSPISPTGSLPEISTTSTTVSTAQAGEMNLSVTPDTTTTTIANNTPEPPNRL